MKALLAATAIATTVALSAAMPAQAPSAADVAARLQARQSKITSFTTRYSQETQAPLLPQKLVASGTLRVLKPRRLWMAQEKPDAKFFVADGTYIWDYDVANKYTIKSRIPDDPSSSTSMMLLTGSADLTRDFTPTLAPNAPPNEWHLVLTPKAKNAEFVSLTMMVTRDQLNLVGLITLDSDGQKHTYRFTDLRENAPLQNSQFVLKLPNDVHIDSR